MSTFITKLTSLGRFHDAILEIIKSAEYIKEAWDVSDPTNVRPSIESIVDGMEIRNDSTAAHAIVRIIMALKEFETVVIDEQA